MSKKHGPAPKATLATGGWLVCCAKCGTERVSTPQEIRRGTWLHCPQCDKPAELAGQPKED